jgi:hypothetical protein
MRKAWRCLGVCILMACAGCASRLHVTYHSEPQGAVLYQGDRHLGTTPVTVTYEVTDEDKKNGFKRLEGTTVRWISGARAEVEHLMAHFKNGFKQVFAFRRPDVPGYDVDAHYALELQRNAIMAKQAAAQMKQAEAQRELAQAQREQAEAQRQQAIELQKLRRQQRQREVDCESRVRGNTVETYCK